MKRVPIVLAALICATAATAGDHLEPEDSVYAGQLSLEPGYDQALVAAFHGAFERDVQARAIVLPSFQTEYAVGIKQDGRAYRIFYQEMSQQLWQYSVLGMMKRGEITSADPDGKSTTAEDIVELEKSLPPSPKDVKDVRCEYPIEAAFAARIIDAWQQMLRSTRYSKDPVMGLDGTIYHFFAKSGVQSMAGQTWSPDPATAPGMMVAIADAMKALCTAKDAASLRALEASTDKLNAKLANGTAGGSHD